MGLEFLANEVYFELLKTGALTASLGIALRGFGIPNKEDGVSRSVGLNSLLVKFVPAYNTFAPAVAHAFAFYGTTLFFGTLFTGVLSNYVSQNNLFLFSFAPMAAGLELMTAYGLSQDIFFKKTSLSDKLQWAAEFLTPFIAMGVAYLKYHY